jgi:hypothetical protein
MINNRNAAVSLKLDIESGDAVQDLFSRENGLFAVTRTKIFRLRSPDDLDPERAYPGVPWEQSLYLPHGTTDPFVARTIIQTDRIGRIFFAQRTPKYAALTNVSWEMMNSLVSLRYIRDRLKRRIEEVVVMLSANWEQYTSEPALKSLPMVEYYDIEFRSFVNEVRRALTKIGELFSILTPINIKNGHFHKALQWVQTSQGPDSSLASMLQRDLAWISCWIDMRIAIEHPASDKFIETSNFAIEPNRSIRLPTWRFVHPTYDMARPQNLLDVFSTCMQNLLAFFEDLQVILLDEHTPKGLIVDFATVPEEDRSIDLPMRFDVRVGYSVPPRTSL